MMVRLYLTLKQIAAALLCFHAFPVVASPDTPHYPQGEARPGYVADKECAKCHVATAKAWQLSKHSRAMQVATRTSVKGDFDNHEFPTPSGLTTFRREQRQFSIATAGMDGSIAEFPVVYTFGIRPLQQYLVPQAGGRLQAFTLAWDTVRHQWFDLQADEQARPGESLHWTGRYQNWNLMCAECHTTALRKNYDEQKDVYRTTWAAPNVGCQACHGPGRQHVTALREKKSRKTPGYGIPFAANLVDQCASCHARRTRLVEETKTGGPFLDNFQPDTLRPNLYHPDGQQLAEVFEYGSFRQSRMYQAGVVCTDCHSVHSGKLLAEGNTLCARCHNEAPNPKFPGLHARNYDSPEHHFHTSGAEGSHCVDCHMPSRNYMIVHGRRDHAIRIPRPDLSPTLKTPNACNDCHQDRDVAWAVAAIQRHFGQRQYPPHYGEILTAAREGRPGSIDHLGRLAQDSTQPAIVRATAAELFGQIAPQRLPATTHLDPDPAVRSVAAMVLGGWSSDRALPLLLSLLKDPVRAVRIAAARSLAGFGEQVLPPAQRRAQRRALADFIMAQKAMADMPAAQLNMATLYAQTGQPQLALSHYRQALQQDPAFIVARLELADWFADQKRFAEGEQVLRAGMATTTGEAELHYALGVLFARQDKVESAIEELRTAAKLRPNDPRIMQSLDLLLHR